MIREIWDGIFRGPGIYLGTPMDVYRADPCPAPSLNSSTARTALFRSLAHAKAMHPRLTPPVVDDDEDEEEASRLTRAMEIGSGAHSLAFGVGPDVVEVHVANWRRKIDKEARAEIRAGGGIPLKRADYRIAKAMADIARPILVDLLDGSLVAEAMIVCQNERGFWRRGLVDRARADFRVIVDYKTTGLELAPWSACDQVFKAKAHFQEGFYRPILDTLDPDGAGRRRFCFLYQEQTPPFTPILVETSEAGRSLAAEQVAAACNLWDRALVTDEWPGPPLGPHTASPPGWMLEQWARRAEHDETLNDWIDA